MDNIKEYLISEYKPGGSHFPSTQTDYPGEPEEISPLSPSQESAQKRQFIRPISQPLQKPVQKRQFIRPGLASSLALPLSPVPSVPLEQSPTSQQQALEQPASQPSQRLVLSAPRKAIIPIKSQVVSQPLLPTTPCAIPVPSKLKKHKIKRARRIRLLLVICSIFTIIAVVFMSQANGASGAWTADALRTVFGPTITAQIEAWYLGLSDTTHQLQYKLGSQNVAAPWTVGTTIAMPTVAVSPQTVRLAPMPLNRIPALVSPAIHGEGVWITQGVAPSPYNYLPLAAKAFIRPDPSHPYAIVTLLQFDTRFFRLHMVAGTTEPGGPRGFNGPGVIPTVDQKSDHLLAAFNGGFKYADGQYGLKTNGIVYVPPQPNAATIAVTKTGQIILGAWGVDSRLNSQNTNLVAWRQNAALLINNGTINPLTQDGSAWGGTILNSTYTWRSGIGITAHGTLIYAAGDALTALTLGEALHAAGAVMAMQTDINPFWVRAFLYNRNTQGTLNITKLNPAMYGTGTEYLYGTERDFFYLTRLAPPLPAASPISPHETYPQ